MSRCGGTFSCANVFAVAYDGPLCYATLSGGFMNVGGLNVRSRTSYIYDNTDERFTMTDGELDLGASGITTARAKYYNTHANRQGGFYKATANHSVGYYGSPWSGANLNGRFCPIYGTLKGSGTLSAPYRFTGDDNSREVIGADANREARPCINFSDATPATFAGLKSVSILFDAKPSRRAYYLTGAITGLTDAGLPDDNDYSADFTLTVQNGRLALSNSKPAGTYIIVR